MENVQTATKTNLLRSKKKLQVCVKAEDLLSKKAKMLQLRLATMLREISEKEQALQALREAAREKRAAAGEAALCFAGGSVAGDEASVAERVADAAAAELALLYEETAEMRRLLEATTRRTAALSHVLIPRSRWDVRRIAGALEEKARDGFQLQPV
jgi:vacuolar-type H+-ATPase subunit D/Vma8